jgi:hypothetical protein
VNAKQQAKVAWFVHRTGALPEDAERFLKEAKFKMEEAIKLRNAHFARVRKERGPVS